MSPLEVGPTPLALTAAANIRIKDTRAKKRPSGRSDTTERVRQPCCHGREEDPDCQGRLRPWKTHIRSLTLGPTPKHTRTGLKSRIIPDHPGSSRIIPEFSPAFVRIPDIAGFSRKNAACSVLFAAKSPRQAKFTDIQGFFLTSDYGPFLYRLSSSSESG